MFKLCSHNPYYDETLFVGHFLKGLKQEVRAVVASQLPETVDRAILLTHVQEDLAAQKKPWVTKSVYGQPSTAKPDRGKIGGKAIQGDFLERKATERVHEIKWTLFQLWGQV